MSVRGQLSADAAVCNTVSRDSSSKGTMVVGEAEAQLEDVGVEVTRTEAEREAMLPLEQRRDPSRAPGCCGVGGRAKMASRRVTRLDLNRILDQHWPRCEFDTEGPTVDDYAINVSGTVKPINDTDEDWIPAGKRQEIEALCRAQDWGAVKACVGVDLGMLQHERKTPEATAAMILAEAYPRPQDWCWCLVFKCECPRCDIPKQRQCEECERHTVNRWYIERILRKSCLRYAKSITHHKHKHNRIYLRIKESSRDQLLREAERIKLLRSISPLHKDMDSHMEGVFKHKRFVKQHADVRAQLAETASEIFDDLDQDRSRTMDEKEFMEMARRCHVKKDPALLKEIFDRLDEEDDGTPGEIAYAAFERWFIEDTSLNARKFVQPAHVDLHADIGCAPYTRAYHKLFDNDFKSGARQELVRSIFEEELNTFVRHITGNTHPRRMEITDLTDDTETNEKLYPASEDSQLRQHDTVLNHCRHKGDRTYSRIASMSPLCRDVFAMHCPSELRPLQDEWASFHSMRTCDCWQWSQTPLNSIREYYGEEIALYYAWLLMYTHSLFVPAIVGLICFLVQWLQFFTAENNHIYMSPNSNVLTALYAMFLCAWSCVFIQKWRQREAVLKFRWGTEGYTHTERTRKEYDGECNQDEAEKKVVRSIQRDSWHISMADVTKIDGDEVVEGVKTIIKDLANYVKDEREKKAHQRLILMWRSFTSAGLLMFMVALVVSVCTIAMYMKGRSVIACNDANAGQAPTRIVDVQPSASCVNFVSQNLCDETVVLLDETVVVRELCADLCTNWDVDNCTIFQTAQQCTGEMGRAAACKWMEQVPSAGPVSAGSCADACMNRRRDTDEMGTDCGGPCSAECPEHTCMSMVLWQVGSVALSVISIFAFEAVYKIIANTLTAWENWRTRSQYEDALIFKNFIFAFVNNYCE